MNDARFEDAPFSDQPLKLRAEGAEDLAIISTLVQDAVCKNGDVHWLPRARRLVLVLHRFRWEDRDQAERQSRPFERVQSALSVNMTNQIKARGMDQSDAAAVQSLLSISFSEEDQQMLLTFAAGAQIVLEAECIDVSLSDLTRPWEASSESAPQHPE